MMNVMRLSILAGLLGALGCGGTVVEDGMGDPLGAEGKPVAITVAMAVSPNPVPAWGTVFTVSGTGFTPGAGVNFVMNGVATFTVADSSGYAKSLWKSWYPGTYTAAAKQLMRRGYEQVGSITFTVQ